MLTSFQLLFKKVIITGQPFQRFKDFTFKVRGRLNVSVVSANDDLIDAFEHEAI